LKSAGSLPRMRRTRARSSALPGFFFSSKDLSPATTTSTSSPSSSTGTTPEVYFSSKPAELLMLNGAIGTGYHVRGILDRPGGKQKPIYNVLYGPPVFAPMLFAACGLLGALAYLMRREPAFPRSYRT